MQISDNDNRFITQRFCVVLLLFCFYNAQTTVFQIFAQQKDSINPAKITITPFEELLQRPVKLRAELNGVHPRLFFTAKDLSAMRTRARSVDRELWQAVLKDIQTLKRNPPDPKDEDLYKSGLDKRKAGSISQYEFAFQIAQTSYAYAIETDVKYLDAAKKWTLTACEMPIWGYTYNKPNVDLPPAHLLYAVSLAYDILFDKLTKEEKEIIKNKLVKQAGLMFDYFKYKPKKRYTYSQNHTWIPAAGLAIAAYVLMDELARAVRQAITIRGYNLFICISEHSAEEDIAAFAALASHSVDGIIVATRSNAAGNEHLRGIVENDVPVVVIGREFEHEAVDYVAADNLNGGFEATRHLIDLGHERIAFIGAALSGKTHLKRLQGYLLALEKHSIEVDERLVTGRKEAISDVPGYSTEEMGYEGMKRLLSLPNRPTAVFARNDFTAIGAMTAIKESGLRIPEDVAIVGFDDIPSAVHTAPPLTTIRQPMRLQGQLAAELLLRRIETDFTLEREERVLNCELIIRGSTVSLKR